MNEDNKYKIRNVPWNGLGTSISGCSCVDEALEKARLNWNVRQASIQSVEPDPVFAGLYKLNIRNTDDKPLGIVTDRYRIVQNREAFAFTDSLVEEGVTFIQAGEFNGGRKVWLLATLPEKYFISGDAVSPYVVFINSHDGSTGIRVSMTPIRVICANMLNLALKTASRTWSAFHTGDIRGKLTDARDTLMHAHSYMDTLGREIDSLNHIKVSDTDMGNMLDALIPIDPAMSGTQQKNAKRQRSDIISRYETAPDLAVLPRNGYRFLNAVSDFATHSEPIRKTAGYQENLFAKAVDGIPLIDKAYSLLLAA